MTTPFDVTTTPLQATELDNDAWFLAYDPTRPATPNDGNRYIRQDYGTLKGFLGGSGSGLPGLDNAVFVQNAADPTKQVLFDASALPTATDATITVPESLTLAGREVDNNFSTKQTMRVFDTGNNNTLDILELFRDSDQTSIENGFGGSIVFTGKVNLAAKQPMGRIVMDWRSGHPASTNSKGRITAFNGNTEIDMIRWEARGSAAPFLPKYYVDTFSEYTITDQSQGAVADVMTVTNTVSGGGANGIGAAILFRAKSNSDVSRLGRISWNWINTVNRESEGYIGSFYATTENKPIRWEIYGTQSRIAFNGKTPLFAPFFGYVNETNNIFIDPTTATLEQVANYVVSMVKAFKDYGLMR